MVTAIVVVVVLVVDNLARMLRNMFVGPSTTTSQTPVPIRFAPPMYPVDLAVRAHQQVDAALRQAVFEIEQLTAGIR